MSLVLLYTGGTIGGRGGRKGSPLTREHGLASFTRLLRRRLPEGSRPDRIRGLPGKLSENMGPEDWVRMAWAVDAALCGGTTGIVVAHGTDTLVYTACALSWLLEGIPVPVILTGSNRPLEEPATDAVQNLKLAFRAAGAGGRPGVRIVYAGRPDAPALILDPRNARKAADRADCFQPVWDGAEGRVSADGKRLGWTGAPPPSVPYAPDFEADDRAALFTVHPGFRPERIGEAVAAGVRGVVLAGYGAGTACAEGEHDLAPAIRHAKAAGVPVWMVSQHGGRVAPTYGSTARLVRAGLRLLPGWTPEAALTAILCRRLG